MQTPTEILELVNRAAKQMGVHGVHWTVVSHDDYHTFALLPNKAIGRIDAALLGSSEWVNVPFSQIKVIRDKEPESRCRWASLKPRFTRPYCLMIMFVDGSWDRWLIIPSMPGDRYAQYIELCEQSFRTRYAPLYRLLSIGVPTKKNKALLNESSHAWTAAQWALRILRIEKGDFDKAQEMINKLILLAATQPGALQHAMHDYIRINEVSDTGLAQCLRIAHEILGTLRDRSTRI